MKKIEVQRMWYVDVDDDDDVAAAAPEAVME